MGWKDGEDMMAYRPKWSGQTPDYYNIPGYRGVTPGDAVPYQPAKLPKAADAPWSLIKDIMQRASQPSMITATQPAPVPAWTPPPSFGQNQGVRMTANMVDRGGMSPITNETNRQWAVINANEAERRAQAQRQAKANEWYRINSGALGPTAGAYDPNKPLEEQIPASLSNPFLYSGRITPTGPITDQNLANAIQREQFSPTTLGVPGANNVQNAGALSTYGLNRLGGYVQGSIGVGGDESWNSRRLDYLSNPTPGTSRNGMVTDLSQDASRRLSAPVPSQYEQLKKRLDQMTRDNQLSDMEAEAAYKARLQAAQRALASLNTTDGNTPQELKDQLDAIMVRYVGAGRYGSPEMYAEMDQARKQFEINNQANVANQYAFYSR